MGAGADHLRACRVPFSELGGKVADLVGLVVHGVHHWPNFARQRWDTEYCIRLTYDRSMATYDNCDLTSLVVLAHDLCIRVEISPCNFRYFEIQFHQRQREGRFSDRHPTIEAMVAGLRRSFAESTEPPKAEERGVSSERSSERGECHSPLAT